jgi:hypothetical protein
LSNLNINIISFNVPYPPDYGGVIDVYYKIKALFEAGVKVHLHCFQYGREKNSALNDICESVNYYPRDAMWKGFLTDKPFIVQSRNAPALLKNLKKNSFPILFEGIHSCYYLTHPDLNSRNKIVRMHNNEPAYYLNLGQKETRFFNKVYFFAEYRRLMKYEWVLSAASQVFCISHPETTHYRQRFPKTEYLAAFNGNSGVTSLTGIGEFVLYHGNLAVKENEEAVLYAINEIFSKNNIPFVIAGNNPSQAIIAAATPCSNITIKANLQKNEMAALIQSAHIHYLPTFQSTGIKLKLLNALYQGRFCIVNQQMIEGTGLEPVCKVANSPAEVNTLIEALFKQSFTQADIALRQELLQQYSDTSEVKKIITLL